MGPIMNPGPIMKSSQDLRSLNDRESTPERLRIERILIQTGRNSSPSLSPWLKIHTGMFMAFFAKGRISKVHYWGWG